MSLEIIVLIGTFLGLILTGVLSALSDGYSQKRESKWAFSPVIQNENSNSFQPIDEASRYGTVYNEPSLPEAQLSDNTIVYEQVVNQTELAEFSHSVVPEEVNNNLEHLMATIDLEMKNSNETGNISHLNDEVKRKIQELVGEKTSRLVTNLLSNLKENELSVVMGLFNPDDNTINFDGETLKLSTTKDIVSGETDYVLVKGALLPNGEFRVIHTDDAETVEFGYGVESFILPKVA